MVHKSLGRNLLCGIFQGGGLVHKSLGRNLLCGIFHGAGGMVHKSLGRNLPRLGRNIGLGLDNIEQNKEITN